MAGNRGPDIEPGSAPGEDAWKLERAARFLGMSPRTLERYVARRMIPCIVYPPARVDAAGEGEGPTASEKVTEKNPEKGSKKGTKPMIAFDPADLAAWRDQHRIGKTAA